MSATPEQHRAAVINAVRALPVASRLTLAEVI